MKKLILFYLITILILQVLKSQNVGIGTNSINPHQSALLDLTANDKGLLIPRLTQTERNSIQNPAVGLLIYQTDNEPFFYFFNGINWQKLCCNQEYSCGDNIYDVQGNQYQTVLIGNQCWMKENLRTTKYKDNTAITKITSNSTWVSISYGAFCWYNNDSLGLGTVYGAIYNWHAANTGILCPEGWHIPSNVEWQELATFLGGINGAGGKMKQPGTVYWLSPNTGATNSSGYTALPAGGRRYDTGAFYVLNENAVFWSSDTPDVIHAWGWNLNYNDANLVSTSLPYKINGRSVRCLKDL